MLRSHILEIVGIFNATRCPGSVLRHLHPSHFVGGPWEEVRVHATILHFGDWCKIKLHLAQEPTNEQADFPVLQQESVVSLR